LSASVLPVSFIAPLMEEEVMPLVPVDPVVPVMSDEPLRVLPEPVIPDEPL
jgi:hypothetical protein